MNLINNASAAIATVVAKKNGTCTFTNVPYGTYTTTAQTNIIAGRVGMGDTLLMFLHLCNLYPFTPIHGLAPDIDSKRTVTRTDYRTAVIGWFVKGNPFTAGSWTFEDITFALTGAKTNAPTTGGLSIGNINGTFVPATRNLAALDASFTPKYADGNFSVEIYAKDLTETAAMGMVINYPSAMVDVSSLSLWFGEPNMAIENSRIRLSWINQNNGSTSVIHYLPIPEINGKTNSNFNGSGIKFIIEPAGLFCNYKGEQTETRYALPQITNPGSVLASNYLNPFSGSTNITYSLPIDTKVKICMFNQKGLMVKVLKKDAYKTIGTHNIVYERNGPEAGVYYYTLKTSGAKAIDETKRMIITR